MAKQIVNPGRLMLLGLLLCLAVGTFMWAGAEKAEAQTPALPTPTGVTATVINETKVLISWNLPSGGGYQATVQWKMGDQEYSDSRGTPSNFLISPNNVVVPRLITGTEYTFRVKHRSGTIFTSDSAWSAEVAATPAAPTSAPAEAPVLINTSPRHTSIFLQWIEIPGATDYEAQWGTASDFSDATDRDTFGNPNVSIRGLSTNTDYYVRARATNPHGNGPWGELQVTTYHEAPTNVTASRATVSSIQLSWDAVAGAGRYEYQISPNTFFSDPPSIYTPSTTTASSSVTISPLWPSLTYYFRVRVSEADGSLSHWSHPIPSASTLAPTARPTTSPTVTITQNDPGQFAFNFGPAAQGTEVEWEWADNTSFSSGFPNEYRTGTIRVTSYSPVSSYHHGGTLYGTTIYVRARVNNSFGNGPWSRLTRFTTADALPAPAPATNLRAVSSTTQTAAVDVSWTASANADSYRVEYTNTSGDYSGNLRRTVFPGTNTSTTISPLLPGSTYYFRVVSVRQNSLPGTPTTEVSATASSLTETAPAPATGLTAAPSSTSVALSWTAGANADSYRVEWSRTSGDFSDTNNRRTVVGTSATISPLLSRTTYYFRVVSRRTSAPDGTPTAQVSATTTVIVPAPAPATSLRATSSTTESGVILNWAAGSNADSYRVEWPSTSNDFSDTANRRTVIGTTTAISPLLPGTRYYFRVVSLRRGAPDGTPTAQVSAVTNLAAAAAPTGVTATAAGTGINVSWTASTGATSYNLSLIHI